MRLRLIIIEHLLLSKTRGSERAGNAARRNEASYKEYTEHQKRGWRSFLTREQDAIAERPTLLSDAGPHREYDSPEALQIPNNRNSHTLGRRSRIRDEARHAVVADSVFFACKGVTLRNRDFC